MGVGPWKTPEKWRDALTSWKNATKAKARSIQKQARATGGGPATMRQLTPTEERLIMAFGEQTLTGTGIGDPCKWRKERQRMLALGVVNVEQDEDDDDDNDDKARLYRHIQSCQLFQDYNAELCFSKHLQRAFNTPNARSMTLRACLWAVL